MNDIAIEVKNLSKTYKIYHSRLDRIKEALNPFRKKYHHDFNALQDVSFTIKKGETVGIIGKNGSGKSTLLKIISGIVTPTKGEVTVQGKIAALLELGAGFNPEFTGLENIYFQGTLMGFTRQQMTKKIPQIIEFADIGEFIDQPVKSYSSGMFARLAFSVAINVEPDILIVDEALAVGDAFFQQKCNLHIKNKMSHITKILVSHDSVYITKFANSVKYLDNGKLVADGDPLTVMEQYLKKRQLDIFGGSLKNSNLNLIASNNNSFWNSIEINKLSGKMDLLINRYRIFINDQPSTGVVKHNDSVVIEYEFLSQVNLDNLIFGYSFLDRHGLTIFGRNSFDKNNMIYGVKINTRYIIGFNLIWPDVFPGEYFLTLGIGSGSIEEEHDIHCWAHNILNLKSTSNNSVHGVFNGTMQNLTLKEYHV